MSVKIKDFDIAEQLNTEEDIDLYLNEALKEDDPRILFLTLDDIAKARNISNLTRKTKIS